ncbi:MAG: PPC domain-containing protein [Candidatus Hydrogenedentes bacterium]|nr:PPC domain-containing protein [Candidatus Hydrogenedentota bacterium]
MTKAVCDSVVRLSVAVLILAGPAAWAGPPSLGDISPRGAARGGAVEVVLSGSGLTNAQELLFHDPGITVAEIKPEDDAKVRCTLNIAPDCPLGTHAIRIRTAGGVSNLKLFSVGALAELAEDENVNNDLASAPAVALGTTINGSIGGEDVDYYAVELPENGRLTAEVEAMRLGGALFDPKLRLFSPSGHEVIAEDDTALLRQDAAFVYQGKEAGRYVVAVSEAAYGGGGGFNYRLHIGQFPRPLMMTPLGGQPESQVNVTWLGDPGLAPQAFTAPAAPLGTGVLQPASDLGVAPSPMPFRVSDLPGAMESEPNNAPEQASTGAAPGAFDGVLSEAGDVDWWRFDGKAGQVYDVRVYARELGSPLDSVMVINNPSGSQLAANDDGAGLDSYVRVTLAEDGSHTLSVRDQLGSGGGTFAYRVEISPVKPSLKLGFLENEAACLTVAEGNRSFFLLSAARAEFDGPLTLTFDGLPQGVTASFDEFPAGQGAVPVVLEAAPDAPVAGALAAITGKLNQEGSGVQGGINYNVDLIIGNNKTVFWSRPVDRMALAVAEPAPFKIDLVAPKAPVVQNGSMNLKVVATRAEGFQGKIALRIPWVSSGVGAGTAEIAPDATETNILINANNNAAVGTWRMAVVGSSEGYTVSTALTPVTVQAPWVTFEVTKAETEQGKPAQLVVNVTQAQEYTGTYKAELLGLPKGVTSQPLDITHDTTQLTFPLEVAADAPAGKFQNIFVRSVLATEGEEVLHQSGGGNLTIYEPLPPALQEAAPAPAPEAPKPDEPKRKTRFPANT